MPRNGSGTYTLPASNPVVAGTTIEASWANNTMSDIATELTGSLSRSGAGGMTGPLRLDAGTSSVPGLAWSAETTTGWYRAGTGDIRFAVTTVDVLKVQSTGLTLTGALSVSGTTTLTGAATLTANPTLSAGTANGVLYLDGSKVATSGSALTFDGTNFGIGTASPGTRLDVAGVIRIRGGNSLTLQNAAADANATISASGGSGSNAMSFNSGAMVLDASNNLRLNTSIVGFGAAGVLALGTGTAPLTGPADSVQLFSVDLSAGNTILAIRCEGSGVTNASIASVNVTNKIAVQVNGTIYYLLATTNA